MLSAGDHKGIEAEIAQSEGRYLDAVRLLGDVPVWEPLLRGKRVGLLYLAAGDAARARETFLRTEHDGLGRMRQGLLTTDDLQRLAMVQSLLGKHAEALATIASVQDQVPEKSDAINGPAVSFVRSIILVRAGRRAEGYAEADRLLRVPFGAPTTQFFGNFEAWELVPEAKDPHFDALINHPPRL